MAPWPWCSGGAQGHQRGQRCQHPLVGALPQPPAVPHAASASKVHPGPPPGPRCYWGPSRAPRVGKHPVVPPPTRLGQTYRLVPGCNCNTCHAAWGQPPLAGLCLATGGGLQRYAPANVATPHNVAPATLWAASTACRPWLPTPPLQPNKIGQRQVGASPPSPARRRPPNYTTPVLLLLHRLVLCQAGHRPWHARRNAHLARLTP